MAKVSIETVHEAASEQLAPQDAEKLVKAVESKAQVEAEIAASQREERAKKQWAIVVSDPNGNIPHDVELVGWVIQIPEDDAISSVIEKIERAAYDHNISKRGRRYPVKSIGEAMEAVPVKTLKEQGLAVKTRIPVFVTITNNQISEVCDGE